MLSKKQSRRVPLFHLNIGLKAPNQVFFVALGVDVGGVMMVGRGANDQ